MANAGVFIVLEGLDGSGTTTQTSLLKEWFRREGAKYGACVATCEPTAGPAGVVARLALNHRMALDNRTMALLFAADRTDHVFKADDGRQEPGLVHLLQQGVHVISDRYLLSSLAYQSLDLPMEWIFRINGQVITPDVTAFLDIDPQISGRRLLEGRMRRDLFEAADIQSRVRAQYEEAMRFLQNEGHCIRRIDANQPEDSVCQDIIKEILPFLEKSAPSL